MPTRNLPRRRVIGPTVEKKHEKEAQPVLYAKITGEMYED
jgi:hypothetical protein